MKCSGFTSIRIQVSTLSTQDSCFSGFMTYPTGNGFISGLCFVFEHENESKTDFSSSVKDGAY